MVRDATIAGLPPEQALVARLDTLIPLPPPSRTPSTKAYSAAVHAKAGPGSRRGVAATCTSSQWPNGREPNDCREVTPPRNMMTTEAKTLISQLAKDDSTLHSFKRNCPSRLTEPSCDQQVARIEDVCHTHVSHRQCPCTVRLYHQRAEETGQSKLHGRRMPSVWSIPEPPA